MSSKLDTTDEITVRCQVCNEKIPVDIKLDHQRHHKALKTLKYKDQKGAATVDVLLERRKQILKKLSLKHEQSPDYFGFNRRLNGVDEAFDVARSELLRCQGVFTTLRPLIEKVRVKDGGLCFSDEEIHRDVKSSPVWGDLPDFVNSVGTSYAKNIQSTDKMEDRMTTHPQFVSLDQRKEVKSNAFFIGVYDGHRGYQAAELTQSHLHRYIKQEIEEEKSHSYSSRQFFPTKEELEKTTLSLNQGIITDSEADTNPRATQAADVLSNKGVLRACKRAYHRMDDYLSWGINETSKVRWSSCSVATCIIDDVVSDFYLRENQEHDNQILEEAGQVKEIGRLWMANTGNVEAYLSHNNQPYALTQKHTCDNESECSRIEKVGGKIVSFGKNKLVNGLVSTTRGLGNHGDVPLRRCVTCDPHTSTARLTNKSQFVVIATSSVWSMFTVEEVFSLVKSTERHVEALEKPKSTELRNSSLLQQPDTEMKEIIRSSAEFIQSEEELTHQVEEVEIVFPAEEEEDNDEVPSNKNYETIENYIARLSRQSKEGLSMARLAYKTWLAAAMSNRIVQAAIKAGASENVSAAVILFRGFFN